jgi:hypothetical protein
MTVDQIVRGIQTRDDVAAEGSRGEALIVGLQMLDTW